MLNLVNKLFGSSGSRLSKSYTKTVEIINRLENNLKLLSDSELKKKTSEFREKIKNGISLDEILPEAFAVVREASKRTIQQRHFDVQLIGGIVLHKGMIAEMKTGEGKTLVATLTAYLNSLNNKPVHIITVNDYLAERDSQWMGLLFEYLGLSVGCILNQMDNAQRKEMYSKDITYGTNSQFGFDYLRDNMAVRMEDQVQRGHVYAIVDEVDSVLIDEARTPLIISGVVNTQQNEQYSKWKIEVSSLLKKQNELINSSLS